MKGRASILIEAEAPRVFDFVASDFASNYPRWSPEVQRFDLLTPGPLRVGSRARQIRLDKGRRSDTTFCVESIEPPSQVTFAEQTGLFRTQYLIEAADARSHLHFTFELQRLELYMRPFEKLIRAAIQEGAERVVHNIKGLLEREQARPSGGQP